MDHYGLRRKREVGAEGGIRTRTPQGALDPESSASASFATSAWIVLNGVKELAIIISFCLEGRQAANPIV